MFNWFKRKKERPIEDDIESNDGEATLSVKRQQIEIPTSEILSSLIFNITMSGEVKIQFYWSTMSIGEATTFSELLFKLNNGDFIESTVEALSNVADDKPEYNEFINVLLNSWLNMETADDNSPLVKPTDALKVGRDKLT